MSLKTAVIEHLFNRRWDPVVGALTTTTVDLQEVTDAIVAVNASRPAGTTETLSSRNAANFFKDFLRNIQSANVNWPATVLARGFTARQVTGGGACFEFSALPVGQTAAFVPLRAPGPTTPRHRIETASLPLASRRLGRREETWLTQVIVRVRLLEAHFSLFAGLHVVQIDHLQMGVKLGAAEIDALFLGVAHLPPAAPEEFIISCEAKGLRDDILEDQVIAQVKAVFAQPSVLQDRVVPVAVKVCGDSLVHLVQFEAVTRAQALGLTTLAIRCDVVYELVPPVPGIR